MIFQEYKISDYQYVYVFSENTRLLTSVYYTFMNIQKDKLDEIRRMEKWESAFFDVFKVLCLHYKENVTSRIEVDKEAMVEYLIFDNYKTKTIQ